MAFSSRALTAIETFAANLKLPAQAAVDGSYSFVFQRSGTLTLTAATSGHRLVASLSKHPSRMNDAIAADILSLAGPDITTQRALSAGLARDGSVVVAVSIDDDEISLPVLETCLQQLLAAQSSVT